MVGLKLVSEEAGGVHSGRLVGSWMREPRKSDMYAYSRQLDMMNIKGIRKFAALNLFKSLEIHTDNVGLSMSMAAPGVPFTVKENYLWSKKTAMKRRDGKLGYQHGALQTTVNGLQVEASWGHPNPGKFVEFYSLDDQDKNTLVVRSVTEINGEEISGMQVYRRI
eukprot:jgi/Botrbrau1/8632/Bobra.0196s0026.1